MTINVHKNKQRSCKHLKSCRKIHEFRTGYPINLTPYRRQKSDNVLPYKFKTSTSNYVFSLIKKIIKELVTSSSKNLQDAFRYHSDIIPKPYKRNFYPKMHHKALFRKDFFIKHCIRFKNVLPL